MRRFLFFLHSWMGLIAGLGLIVIGLTGSVLVFRQEIDNLVLRWNLSARIFFSDLHKMVGISSVGFNLILGFTGAYWNLTHVVGHLLDGPDPKPPNIKGRVFAKTLSQRPL